MMRHRNVQQLLYDYVSGEMDPRTRQEVRDHLAKCKRCSIDREVVETLLNTMPLESQPSDHSMDQRDWETLHSAIMRRVNDEGVRKTWVRLFTFIQAFPSVRIRPGYVLAAGVVVSLLVIIFLFGTSEHGRESMIPRERVEAPGHRSKEEIERYFRKSRVLLVGLSNLEPSLDATVDLSAERELSRQLILEGRSLRGQNLDPRSSRLIGDLGRIMERVSSTPEAAEPPELQTIRSDIRGHNLLVKLRVAEASYSAIPITKIRKGL